MKTRRVVTGHDDRNRSVFVADESVDTFTIPGAGEMCRVWSADAPATYPDAGKEPGGEEFFPAVGGVRFMLMEFAVQDGSAEVQGGDDIGAHAPGLLDAMDADDPGMHTTDTTDFDIVLSGSVILELDDGAEVLLGPGDVVVQNGTRHRWRNGGDGPATMAVFVVGAHRSGG